MRQQNCPVCGAPIDRRRLPPENLWNLGYTFRCQTCATMLRWDTALRDTASTVLFLLWCLIAQPLLWNVFDSAPRTVIRELAVLLAVGGVFRIAIVCIPSSAVYHSDE